MKLTHEYFECVDLISWEEILKLLGFSWKKQGRCLLIRCPLHKERTASMLLHPIDERGKYDCRGCHHDGDKFDFVALIRYRSKMPSGQRPDSLKGTLALCHLLGRNKLPRIFRGSFL